MTTDGRNTQVPGLRFDDAGPAPLPRAVHVARVIDSYLDQPEHGGRRIQFPTPPPRPRVEEPRTRDELRAVYADVTPLDLLLAGAAAVTSEEVDQVAHLSMALFDHTVCLTGLTLPDGRTVASLHAHISRWRHRPGGLTTTETHTSARITARRPPLAATA